MSLAIETPKRKLPRWPLHRRIQQLRRLTASLK